MSSTSRRDAPVALVSCPPLVGQYANIALGQLSAMLRGHGIDTWIGDLNIELYNLVESGQRKFWECPCSAFWAHPRISPESMSAAAYRLVDGFADKLMKMEGDLVGFSTHGPNLMYTLEMARLMRERGCQKVFMIGGPSVQLMREGDPSSLGLMGFQPEGGQERMARAELARRLDDFDVYVIGEGEETLLDLAQRHREGRSLEGTPGALLWNHGKPGGYEPRPLTEDLDTLPFPTYEGFDLKAYDIDVLPMLLSRGCVRRCSMCYERILWPAYRHRSVGNVIAEMRDHIERHGISAFACHDLAINGSLSFLLELCDQIIANGLKVTWWGNAVVHRGMTLDDYKKLKQAGVHAMEYGVESAAPRTLAKMGKGFSAEDAEHSLRMGEASGITNVINLIVGFPGETAEDHQMTLDFVERNHERIQRVGVLSKCVVYERSALSTETEDFDIYPETVVAENPFNPATPEWEGPNGMGPPVRDRRFKELFQLIRSHGIDVTGIPDDEKLTPELVCELVKNLESPIPLVREDAITRLSHSRDASLAPAMIARLDDPEFRVKSQALLNLSKLDPDRAWEVAAELLPTATGFLGYASALVVGLRTDDRSMDLLEGRVANAQFEFATPRTRRRLAPHRELYKVFERFQAEVEAGEPLAMQQLLAHPRGWVHRRGLRWIVKQRPPHAPCYAQAVVQALPGLDGPTRMEALEFLALPAMLYEGTSMIQALPRLDGPARTVALEVFCQQLSTMEFDPLDLREVLLDPYPGVWPLAARTFWGRLSAVLGLAWFGRIDERPGVEYLGKLQKLWLEACRAHGLERPEYSEASAALLQNLRDEYEAFLAQLIERLPDGHPALLLSALDSLDRFPGRASMEPGGPEERNLLEAEALLRSCQAEPDRAWSEAARLAGPVDHLLFAVSLVLARRLDDRTMGLLRERLLPAKYAVASELVRKALSLHREFYADFERFQVVFDSSAPTALTRILAHRLPWMRRWGLQWLHEARRESAPGLVECLLEALRQPEAGVRYHALLALGCPGVDFEPLVLDRLLADEDLLVRREAGLLFWEKVAPRLGLSRASGQEPGCDAGYLRRLCAAWAPAGGQEPAPGEVGTALEGTEELKRYYREFARRFVEELSSDEAARRRAGILALGRLDQPGTDERLLPLIEDADAGVAEAAVAVLRRWQSPLLAPYLAQRVSDPGLDGAIRARELEALGGLEPGLAWERAADLIRREQGILGYTAALVVALRDDPPSMDLLEGRLPLAEYAAATAEAREALAPHRELYAEFERFQTALDESRPQAVSKLLSHPSCWVRRRGLQWIHEARHLRAAERKEELLEALAQPFAEVRYHALRALACRGVELDPLLLERVLLDTDERVRWEAATLFWERLRGTSDLNEDPARLGRLESAWAATQPDGGAGPDGRAATLTRHYERFRAGLIGRLASPEIGVRRSASLSLGRLKDLAAERALLPLIDGPCAEVASEAIAALARMQSPLVVRHLPQMLGNSGVSLRPPQARRPFEFIDALQARVRELEPLAVEARTAPLEEAWHSAGPLERLLLLEMLERTASAASHVGLLRQGAHDGHEEVRERALCLARGCDLSLE